MCQILSICPQRLFYCHFNFCNLLKNWKDISPFSEAIDSSFSDFSHGLTAWWNSVLLMGTFFGDFTDCTRNSPCVEDTGWGNGCAEGTDVRTVKPFAISPMRLYQARSSLTIQRISNQGSRAVIYRVTLIKLK